MTKHKVRRTLCQCILAMILIASAMHIMAAGIPTATTGAASSVGSAEATLNGTVNANDGETTVTFEYGLTTGYGGTFEAVQSPVSGTTDTAVSVVISELLPNTTYHYRVVAQNAYGTAYGSDMTFTTLPNPPPAVTNAASGIGAGSATLNGTVHPQGANTTVTFEYGTDTGYGTTVTADQSPLTTALFLAWPVSHTITGLANNTTYHYRVVATNAGGTTTGADMTFTIGTVGTAPTAATGAATGVGTTGATLNGTVNAGDSQTTVTFEYGLTTGYGSTVTAVQSPVTGTTNTAVSADIYELLPNTTYYYRVAAQNANGTATGADMTFTTLPQAPIATTNGATAVGTASATLNGTVNANNASTTVTFQYGTTTGYGTTVTADQSPVSGAANTAVSRAISGLSNGVTYHYRVAAVNAGGTTYGADMTFTTGATAPTAATNAASGVSTTGATLNGTVNAQNSSTTVTFQYGLDTNYGRSVSANPDTVTGSTNTAVNAAITDLLPNTTYHYRVAAVNAGGTTYGADMTFTTLAAPTVTTNGATAVTTTGATLNGTVNANNSSTTVTFQYGTSTGYGTTVTADQSPVTGTANTAVSKAITGLTPNTTYHYRVVGQNVNGTTYGADMTFYTGASAAPTAATNAATAVGSTAAILNGTVNAQGAGTTVTFEYGETTGYGRVITADQSPVSGSTDTAVSGNANALIPNTTYHYRVVAQNVNDTVYGADMTFTTSGIPPSAVTGAATGVTTSGATLNGTVNAQNDSTTVTFQYGLDTGYGSSVPADQSPVSGYSDTAVSADITALSPGTTYHFRVVGQNATGTGNGLDMIFTTNGAGTASVTTANVTTITAVSAIGGGNVIAEGDAPVTARGVCWSTAPNPTTADHTTANGSGAGAFTGVLTGLTPSTTYYVRAYATNLYGTAYGGQIQFATNGANTPIVTTADVTHITETSAQSGGHVIEAGSTPVTARGVCWSSAANPTTADRHTVDGSGPGAFTSLLTGLKENSAYYVRAYATNSYGTAYGGQLTFKTGAGAFSVVITNPADRATVSGTVTISASVTTAAADAEITAVYRVAFYIDGTKIAEDTAAPYKTQWDTTAYADGSHTVKAVAYTADNQSARDEITVTVNNVPPEIWVNRSAFNFGSNGTHTTGAQTLLIDNSGSGSLNWHIDTDEAWLSCTPAAGVGSGAAAVSVDPAGLAAGTHSASITVSDSSAANSPVFIGVTLKIYDPGAATTPFGYIITPIDGLTVTGSIPVTGWVLDDIETAAVNIFRNPVAGEGGSLIYLGDAVFVEGARPLMEEAYPDLPLNHRAGWGYMLLTNLLPDQGNGTFKLFAMAVDKEGHQVMLGTRTIAADNANAYKPFGAIDTPAQGEIVSGHSYVNSGWVLTPQPYTIPADGSTIAVRVDGVRLGSPVYDQYRPDIAALFPGYNNGNGAGGYFYLDTTAYGNGVHTISWTAGDNGGNRDCIGIHYFSIRNIGSSSFRAAAGSLPGMPYESHFYEADTGELAIQIQELEHVEIRLAVNPSAVTGYLDVNGVLKSLPVGSTLDQKSGRFFWSPGPGFVGPYTLLFIIEGPGGQTSQKTVEILIQPRH